MNIGTLVFSKMARTLVVILFGILSGNEWAQGTTSSIALIRPKYVVSFHCHHCIKWTCIQRTMSKGTQNIEMYISNSYVNYSKLKERLFSHGCRYTHGTFIFIPLSYTYIHLFIYGVVLNCCILTVPLFVTV